jgi:hypothetical protein
MKKNDSLANKNGGIRHDMSQFYPLKDAMECILGHKTYMRLKETATLSDWKKESKKLLNAIELAVNQTVEIADEDFYKEIHRVLELGRECIPLAENAADLFSYLSATLARLTFLQIGLIPSRHLKVRPLIPRYWKLSAIRSVQYVQNENQKQTAREMKSQGVRGKNI